MSEAGWSVKLRASNSEMDQVLSAGDPARIIRLFRSYRSQALRSFNQVDRDLLAVCEALRQVGEPLAVVLRMMV